MTKDEFLGAVAETKEHIRRRHFPAVLSHRFKRTYADPLTCIGRLRGEPLAVHDLPAGAGSIVVLLARDSLSHG